MPARHAGRDRAIVRRLSCGLFTLWLWGAAVAQDCPPLVAPPPLLAPASSTPAETAKPAAGAMSTARTSVPTAAPAAATPAVDRGLLWRVTRGGHSSYLYGTVHVGKPAWTPGPLTLSALKSSDVLALELDPNDPAMSQALSRAALPPPLTPALQQRLQRAFDRACLSRAALAGLHPVLQATTLAVLEARWLGLDPQYAQEQLLLPLARQRGLTLATLETPAQQLAVLLPPDPATVEATLSQTLAQLEDGSGRRVLQRLSEAWAASDLERMADFERWCECAASEAERAELRRFNDARNPGLADGIEALHRAGRRVFAAVGALHMTGAQSLPTLLAARGFAVERIRFPP